MTKSKKRLNRIKVVLAEKEKTNADLARALEKNQATVSRWCTNDAQPGLETLFEIADFLKVNVSDLIAEKK
ncbi:helix-turn-helix transcriptional regulator [Fulvivirga sp. M361]|uniref:helix-turn-helix transcriptional regulator n=1 Tax=Fulvivirga sp. M361 TaxID=2594266 RepID=UPI00117B2C49|nr:helix-turn-helix transcriptional regulator [Fulvivirga sp. M361]TRX50921.1 helix-turn-helix transcriptional regulator [Fulvivirga sp. M361]